MGSKSVFQFIDTDNEVENMGTIHGAAEVGDATILREPEAGSFEELDATLDPKPGFAKLQVKGSTKVYYVVLAAKANFA